MKVTVIMPVYNAEPYVSAAIESVLNQTHTSFEFIIVNDGSTDGGPDILRRFAEKDSRIILVEQANRGASSARNAAVKRATTEWVFQIDADDLMHRNRIERQLAFLADNPDLKVASCFGYYVNDAGRRCGRITHDLTTREKLDWYLRHDEVIGIMNPGVVFSREVFDRVGGYRPHIFPAEDTDLWNRVAETGAPILVQPEYLMDMHIHPGSTTGRDFMASRARYEWVREMMRRRRRGEPEPSWEAFESQWHAAPLLSRVNRRRKTEAKRCFRQAGVDWAQGHGISAVFHLTAAILLQPAYALPRLRERIWWRRQD